MFPCSEHIPSHKHTFLHILFSSIAHVMAGIYWDVQPPSNSHQRDYYFFRFGDTYKPLFATIACRLHKRYMWHYILPAEWTPWIKRCLTFSLTWFIPSRNFPSPEKMWSSGVQQVRLNTFEIPTLMYWKWLFGKGNSFINMTFFGYLSLCLYVCFIWG